MKETESEGSDVNGWLWAIAVIAVVIAAVLALPVRVSFSYRSPEDWRGTLGIGGIPLVRFPRPKQAPAPSDESGPSSPTRRVRETLARSGTVDAVRQVCGLLNDLFGYLGGLLRHVHIRHLELRLTVGCDDAAQTALVYGGVSGAVYACLGVLNRYTPVPKDELSVRCDFQTACFRAAGGIRADVPVLFGLICAGKCLKRLHSLTKKEQ